MAFQTKYQINFYDYNDDIVSVEFQTDPWAGAITYFTPGPEPCKLSYYSDDKYQTIVGSSMEFQVVYESAVENLFTESDQAIRVQVTLFANTWSGYVTPFQSRKLMSGMPGYATIMATDQLGVLKNIKFETSGDPYYYIDDEWTFVGAILSKTGYATSVRENINIYESHHNTGVGDSPLTQTYIYPEMYWDEVSDERSDCYSVLEDIVKKYGARVFQSNTCWYIQRPNAMWSSHTERLYSGAYSYLSNSTGFNIWNRADNGGIWMGEPEIIRYGRVGRSEITAEPIMRDNLIKNGTFEDFTQDGYVYYWTGSASPPDISYSDGYITMGDVDAIGDPDEYISMDFYVYRPSAFNMIIEFKGVYSGGTTCILHFGIYLVEAATWWDAANSNWSGSEVHYEFNVNTEVAASMTEYARLTIPISMEQYNWDRDPYWMRVYIYEVEDNNDTTASVAIRNIRLEPSYAANFQKQQIVSSTNTVSANNTITDMIRHCDSWQSYGDPDQFFVLMYGTAFDEQTISWKLIGDTETAATPVYIQQLLAKQRLEGNYTPLETIRGRLRSAQSGGYQYFYALEENEVTDSKGFPKIFIPLDMEYDARRCEWEGTWIECSPIYTLESNDWADHDFAGSGNIDGDEIEINNFTITAGSEEGRFDAYTAVIGENIRLLIHLFDDGASDLPTMTMGGTALTVAWGWNYITYRAPTAGSKTLIITGEEGDVLNLTCSAILYSLAGL